MKVKHFNSRGQHVGNVHAYFCSSCHSQVFDVRKGKSKDLKILTSGHSHWVDVDTVFCNFCNKKVEAIK